MVTRHRSDFLAQRPPAERPGLLRRRGPAWQPWLHTRPLIRPCRPKRGSVHRRVHRLVGPQGLATLPGVCPLRAPLSVGIGRVRSVTIPGRVALPTGRSHPRTLFLRLDRGQLGQGGGLSRHGVPPTMNFTALRPISVCPASNRATPQRPSRRPSTWVPERLSVSRTHQLPPSNHTSACLVLTVGCGISMWTRPAPVLARPRITC